MCPRQQHRSARAVGSVIGRRDYEMVLEHSPGEARPRWTEPDFGFKRSRSAPCCGAGQR